MSAVIRQMVSRKRAVVAESEAFDRRSAEIIAAAKGQPGDPGPAGPIPKHEWKGSKLRFEQPDGKWGKWTDLKGPRGDDGNSGTVIVRQGGAGSNGLEQLAESVSGAIPTDFAVLQDGQWVRLSWPAFAEIIMNALGTAVASGSGDILDGGLRTEGESFFDGGSRI